MPRTPPAGARTVIEAWKSGDTEIVLIEINHEVMEEVLYVANNNEDITSNGQVYIGFPFKIELPSETDGPPVGKIGIQNVDTELGKDILAMRGLDPASMRMKVVLASDPDSVWLDYKNFSLRNVTGNAIQITADIDKRESGREDWPARRATQDRFPNLYR